MPARKKPAICRGAALAEFVVVRAEGADRKIVRLADGARFAITCPDSGQVTRSWSGIDAAAWVQVLHNPRFTDRVTQGGGTWEEAGAEGAGTMQLDGESHDDELADDEEAGAEAASA